MKKRLRKKIEDKNDRKKALFILKNLKDGSYKIYLAKKHWNKGCRNKGYIEHDKTGDFLTFDYIESLGYEYIGYIKNCNSVNLETLKSWNNKNHLVKY